MHTLWEASKLSLSGRLPSWNPLRHRESWEKIASSYSNELRKRHAVLT